MRLTEVEKGDGFAYRLLIRFISMVSGMRLPDAARIVMYHRDFYGTPMTSWTHAAMRGKSNWSLGERELFAAMTAKWNSCTFCVDAHGSIASLVLEKSFVNAALEDFRKAKLPRRIYAILTFLEIFVKTPDKLTAQDVDTVFQNGITLAELEDAMAVAALFSITVRCADTLNFALLSNKNSIRAAKRMLTRGYAFGKNTIQDRPDHRVLADILWKRVMEGPGVTDTALRQAVAKRTAGGAALEPPYDELAVQIGRAAYKVTDEQVKRVAEKTGSEKATFELIVTAAVSAGLYRWNQGLDVMKKA